MTLLERTRNLLADEAAKRSLRKIAAESGGRVEYDWLKRFAKGEINDPSVNRIQELHDDLLRQRASSQELRA
jgi:hypothetical protein